MKTENITEGLLIWGMIFSLLAMIFSCLPDRILEGRICVILAGFCLAFAIYKIFFKKEKRWRIYVMAAINTRANYWKLRFKRQGVTESTPSENVLSVGAGAQDMAKPAEKLSAEGSDIGVSK
jgi:hypothetical protein